MYKRFHVGLWQTSELHYIRKIDTEAVGLFEVEKRLERKKGKRFKNGR